MKRHLSYLLIILSSTVSQGATEVTEDFSLDEGDFTTLQNTQIVNSGSGALEFTSSNAQGSGVILDFLDEFPNDITSEIAPDFVRPTVYFEISAVVPMPASNFQEELGFLFGPAVTQAQSSSIVSGQNTNGFTFYINDGAVFAPDNGQGTGFTGGGNGGAINLLTGLGSGTLLTGSTVTFNVAWTTVPAQNSGQSSNLFTLSLEGLDSNGNPISATETFDGAQNANDSDINNYQFSAVTTGGLTASINSFTVSDMPIGIPEPSASLMLLLSIPALLMRRRSDSI